MIPDWLIQLTWLAAGSFATGAFFYFLANRNYPGALWTGFAALVLTLTAVAFHMHNGLLQNPVGSDKPLAAETNVPQQGVPTQPSRTTPADSAEQQEADLASADTSYSPMTMEEYFDSWYHKTTTSLQKDALEGAMLNKRVIWTGTIKSIETGSGDIIRVLVEPTDARSGTAFLDFDKSQRPQLVELHRGQQIRFTGRITTFVASPFLSDCRILKVLT